MSILRVNYLVPLALGMATMPALKCPSPSCPFLFDPAQVPPGSILTCPRCGMRFTLGPPAAPPPEVAATQSGSVSVPQQSMPESTGSVELARPEASLVKRSVATDRIRRQAEPMSLKAKLLILAGVMLALIVLGSLAIYFLTRHPNTAGPNPYGSELVVADKNFSFAKLPAGWENDNPTRNMMNLTAFVYHRTSAPEAWVGLSVNDYDTQTPSDSELRKKLLDHLGRAFDDVPEELEWKPITWGGQPAQSTEMRVNSKSFAAPVYLLACYMTYRGWAYWCYAWAKQEDFDNVSQDLVNLRESFRVLNGRSSRPNISASPPVVYRNSSGKYSLTGYERIWKPAPGLKPTDTDANGDLFFKAELGKSAGRDNAPTAELLVLQLSDAGDAAEVADLYVKDRYRRFETDFGKVSIEELKSEPSADEPPGPAGDANQVKRLTIRRGTEKSFNTANKFVVYKAMRLGDRVIVAEASCPLNERDRWEKRFIQLVGSLKAAE